MQIADGEMVFLAIHVPVKWSCCNQNVIKYIFGVFFLHGVAMNKRIVTIFSLELTKHSV